MHCCGAARSRIPICLLRNHPSGDPRLLCCSRLMVVPSLMIEGSSSSSSCLVAQNTPVCPRNCVVLHPKHSHASRGGECSSLANPPGTSGRREPACARQDLHRHSKHTQSTHRQHSHAGYQYPPLGTMGGAHATQSRGGETNDFGAEKTRRGTSSRLR